MFLHIVSFYFWQAEPPRRRLPPGRLYDDFSRLARGRQAGVMDGVVEVESTFVGGGLAHIVVPRTSLSESEPAPRASNSITNFNPAPQAMLHGEMGHLPPWTRTGFDSSPAATPLALPPKTPPLPSSPLPAPPPHSPASPGGFPSKVLAEEDVGGGYRAHAAPLSHQRSAHGQPSHLRPRTYLEADLAGVPSPAHSPSSSLSPVSQRSPAAKAGWESRVRGQHGEGPIGQAYTYARGLWGRDGEGDWQGDGGRAGGGASSERQRATRCAQHPLDRAHER